jgi:hypothetical protein
MNLSAHELFYVLWMLWKCSLSSIVHISFKIHSYLKEVLIQISSNQKKIFDNLQLLKSSIGQAQINALNKTVQILTISKLLIIKCDAVSTF